jgi:hypothetical protein
MLTSFICSSNFHEESWVGAPVLKMPRFALPISFIADHFYIFSPPVPVSCRAADSRCWIGVQGLVLLARRRTPTWDLRKLALELLTCRTRLFAGFGTSLMPTATLPTAIIEIQTGDSPSEHKY